MNTAYVLLRTGYADWEAASALAELRRTFGFAVKTVGLAAETVVSMGSVGLCARISRYSHSPRW